MACGGKSPIWWSSDGRKGEDKSRRLNRSNVLAEVMRGRCTLFKFKRRRIGGGGGSGRCVYGRVNETEQRGYKSSIKMRREVLKI